MRKYMFGFVDKYIRRNRRSKAHEDWWKNRKINWQQAYMDTWDLPHRRMIADGLSRISWVSIWEIGCGPGPNLLQIFKKFGNTKQIGGSDINPEAIELAKSTFNGGQFEVCPNDDIMGSDDFTDIILTDRTLIYSSWIDIHKVMKEIKRCTRVGVMIVEYDTTSWWEKIKLFINSGIYAHDYVTLLRKYGFYDIVKIDIPPTKDSSEIQTKLLKLIYAKR